MRLSFALFYAISTTKHAKIAKLGSLLMLYSCAANGFHICVYLCSSAVPYFRNHSLILKYRR
ncbi:MAG: hypothetical protein WA144_04335, partial [Candidatus Methanoperedens sp.]